MSDPFRSELDAALHRIEQMETEHAARVAELERECQRLRGQLVEVAPSRTKSGRTFLALAAVTLGLSMLLGVWFALKMRPSPSPGTFDPNAAARALDPIRVDDCGVVGVGRAKVTFAPSGLVTHVEEDPSLARSPAGACVAERYRAARVPSFDGPPRTFTRVIAPSQKPR